MVPLPFCALVTFAYVRRQRILDTISYKLNVYSMDYAALSKIVVLMDGDSLRGLAGHKRVKCASEVLPIVKTKNGFL